MTEKTLEQKVLSLENKHAMNAARIFVLERMLHALMNNHPDLAAVRRDFAKMSEHAIAMNLNNPDLHPHSEEANQIDTDRFLEMFDLMIAHQQTSPKR